METIIEEWFFEKTVGFEQVISQIKGFDKETCKQLFSIF